MANPPNGVDPGATPTPGATPDAGPPDGVDLKSILDYDPFDKPAESGKTLEEGQEPAGGNVPAPGADPAQVAPTVPGAPPAPTQLTQEQIEEMIAERVAAQVAERVAQFQPAQPQPGQHQAQPGQQPGAPAPQKRYGFQVPQPIFDGLNSEDPQHRNQALVHVMNGVAEVIHDTVLAQVTQLIESVRQEVPAAAQQTVQRTAEAKAVFDDFYGTYPELNDPNIHALVGQISAKIGAKHRGGWSPALRDEIGREVYRVLKWPVPGARGPVAKPAPSSSTSSRPGAPAPQDEQTKEIMDMFGPS